VAAGFDPQLPLAAFILREGGLTGHEAAHTARLGYMRVKGSNADFKYSPLGKKKSVPHPMNPKSGQNINIVGQILTIWLDVENGPA